jgi:NAD-dependent dihydropyrimidine dehydrogenase PreA subunit
MGEFIKIKIDPQRCVGIDDCGGCIRVCPVNIFIKNNKMPAAVEENEDECTLCDLCMEACDPCAIIIQKLYDN